MKEIHTDRDRQGDREGKTKKETDIEKGLETDTERGLGADLE